MDFASTADLSTTEIFLRLSLTFLMSLIIATIYNINYKGYGRPVQTSVVMIMVAVSVNAIIMAIGQNIALSLGLVGALSIVRFRTAIKDSRDLSYMFWAIATGLAVGAGSFKLAFCLLAVMSVAAFLLERFGLFNTVSSKYILILKCSSDARISIARQAEEILGRAELKSANFNKTGQTEEITLFAYFKNLKHLDDAKQKLEKIEGLSSLNILHPDDAITF